MKQKVFGFTLIELLVVIAIIATLAAVLFASFSDARALARDEARKAALKEVQLALELYRSQNGRYPDAGCSATAWAGPGPHSASWGTQCDEYIVGLVPDFISQLPTDPTREDEDNIGYLYRSDGNSYKLLANRSVEFDFVQSYADEFARCPFSFGVTYCDASGPQNDVYAVYSAGAEDW